MTVNHGVPGSSPGGGAKPRSNARFFILKYPFTMYHVYVLFSTKSNIFYVGQTSDLDERIIQHNETAIDNFTSKHRPWVLKASIAVDDLKKALMLEKFIKRQKRKSFIELLILKHKDIDFLNWLFNKSKIL